MKIGRSKTPALSRGGPALWWVGFLKHRAGAVVTAVLVLTLLTGAYAVLRFEIDTDVSEMISAELPFRRDLDRFRQDFPQLNETLVLVIDAAVPEKASFVQQRLAARFRENSAVFRSVFTPNSGAFFDRHGLLYLDDEALNAFADRLARIQPFWGLLERSFSLPNLMHILTETAAASDSMLQPDELQRMFEMLSDAVEGAIEGRSQWVSWRQMLQNKARQGPYRCFILLWPHLDYTALNPAKSAMAQIDQAEKELLTGALGDVQVRTTGPLALQVENFISVRRGIGAAALASLALVLLAMLRGLRASRLVCFSLLALLVGLIWTLGFAMAAIGRLNLISVTFIVLFIGLGIDYNIQFCLRFLEDRRSGADPADALVLTMDQTGRALVICTVTTGIGFLSFVPTSYSGAAELGIISSVGMVINLGVTLTLLPALLLRWGPVVPAAASPPIPAFKRLLRSDGRLMKGAAFFLALFFAAGAGLWSKVRFDPDPLNLNNPRAVSVKTAKELQADPEMPLWTLSVTTPSAADARAVADRVSRLETVEKTITVFDFVPPQQESKIAWIRDIAALMPQIPAGRRQTPAALPEKTAAVAGFADALAQARFNPPAVQAAAERLHRRLQAFLALREHPRRMAAALNQLEDALLTPAQMHFERLAMLLTPSPFGIDQLPAELKARYVSPKGDYRVHVFPKENLQKPGALKRFVDSVQQAVPAATGAAAGILAAGEAVAGAFKRALCLAFGAVILFLLVIIRRPGDVGLMMIPPVVSLGLAAAAAVMLGIPFNFANIIVLPLILGIGIDYAIHLVHRYRADPDSRAEILNTSTARGIFFSGLTTIASFASLAFSMHRGTAQMGVMLTICIVIMMVCTLVLLPVLLQAVKGRQSG